MRTFFKCTSACALKYLPSSFEFQSSKYFFFTFEGFFREIPACIMTQKVCEQMSGPFQESSGGHGGGHGTSSAETDVVSTEEAPSPDPPHVTKSHNTNKRKMRLLFSQVSSDLLMLMMSISPRFLFFSIAHENIPSTTLLI